MDLRNVISQFEAFDNVKTASAPVNQNVDARLQSVLADTLEKTAANVPRPMSSGDPVQGLMKMASELAGQEKEAELALANMLGQALADGAIAKFAAWDAQVKMAAAQEAQYAVQDDSEVLIKAAAEQGYADVIKLASYQANEKIAGADDETLVKMAAEQGYADVQLVKEATDLGYSDVMEKVAAQQYEAGFNEQVEAIHKVASGEFLKGAAETEILLNAIQQAQ